MDNKIFSFLSYEYDENSSTIKLKYSFNNDIFFEEYFTLHDAPSIVSDEQRQALNVCLYNLHLAAGISYYKAFVLSKIEIKNNSLSDVQAKFFEKFYENGLGEFAYRNNLDVRNKIQFPIGKKPALEASEYSLNKRILVPVGGGKDSTVTIEILKNFNENITLFSLGRAVPIEKTINTANVPFIRVTRKISDNLFELNKKGALNGHVPITGILSFLLTVVSVIYGFDTIVMSNENSANEGNLIVNGKEINHQYSKSFEFEVDFSNYISNFMLKKLNYFSLLRPLSEITIAGIFSKYKQYHNIFTSCNKVFTINEKDRSKSWCCDCPKCRFVFLIFTPFIKKQELIDIFGKNLLDDPCQEIGYRELLGLQGYKPFECVGEITESLSVFCMLKNHPIWKNDFLVKEIELNCSENKNLVPIDEILKSYSNNNAMPSKYKNILNSFLKKNIINHL